MLRWEYAQMQAHRTDIDAERRFFVRFITADGSRIEKPEAKQVKGAFGKMVTVAPTSSECWDWFWRKIAELGQDGWELVNAPDSGITYGGEWDLWFKRSIA